MAPGRTEPRRTLPSFLLLEDGQPVGVYAREQGALVPTKLVHSAKSWLSNPDVDRTAKILAWDSPETGRVLSPVEVFRANADGELIKLRNFNEGSIGLVPMYTPKN